MAECAFDRQDHCCALERRHCAGCVFKKTREELDASRARAEARLATLSQDTRDKIRLVYHCKANIRRWCGV